MKTGIISILTLLFLMSCSSKEAKMSEAELAKIKVGGYLHISYEYIEDGTEERGLKTEYLKSYKSLLGGKLVAASKFKDQKQIDQAKDKYFLDLTEFVQKKYPDHVTALIDLHNKTTAACGDKKVKDCYRKFITTNGYWKLLIKHTEEVISQLNDSPKTSQTLRLIDSLTKSYHLSW